MVDKSGAVVFLLGKTEDPSLSPLGPTYSPPSMTQPEYIQLCKTLYTLLQDSPDEQQLFQAVGKFARNLLKIGEGNARSIPEGSPFPPTCSSPFTLPPPSPSFSRSSFSSSAVRTEAAHPVASLSSFPHPLSVSTTGDGSNERGASRTDEGKREEEEEGEGEEKEGEREVKVGEERGGEGDEGEGKGGENDEGNRETKDSGGVVSEKGGSIETSEHIAAVEDGSGVALPLTTSDPVTSISSPYIKLPTPDPPSDREVGGFSEEDKVGGTAGPWAAESSTENEELTGQVAESSIATLGLTVTSSEARSSGDTTPEDSFHSALSTPIDTSLRQPTNGLPDSQSPVPEADSHSPIPDPDNSVPQHTPPLSSQDTSTHRNSTSLSLFDPSTSQLQPSSSSSGQFGGGGTRQREDEAKWYITFEQFISCVQTEPDLCQFFAEQNTIDLCSSSVDPILSPYTRTVLGLT
ncbi:hypothetical protein GBAR_LOCUS24219 [Geodia barretti]|nr:hypothetical protein GBAR_LOCUS24219 [Geodia barretti]